MVLIGADISVDADHIASLDENTGIYSYFPRSCKGRSGWDSTLASDPSSLFKPVISACSRAGGRRRVAVYSEKYAEREPGERELSEEQGRRIIRKRRYKGRLERMKIDEAAHRLCRGAVLDLPEDRFSRHLPGSLQILCTWVLFLSITGS